jgi:hypothetical protein
MAGRARRTGYTWTWLGAGILGAAWLFGIVGLFVAAAFIIARRLRPGGPIRWDEEEGSD